MTRLASHRVTQRSSVAFAVAAALAAGVAQAATGPAPAPGATVDPPMGMTTLQEVIVTAKERQLKSLKQRSIYQSAYGDKALDRQQLKSAGVVGGAAKALSFAPGIAVTGYGQTGGTKASISINGLNQGWAGVSPGTVDNGNLAISFDGIPMVNAATGLWETPQIPQTALLQGARITYGPGNPETRWYNNMGGGVNFVPVQPGRHAGGSAQLTYGSFNTENADLILQTGKIDGWETIIAGGAGRANSFHTSPDGYAWPTSNYAGFFKTRKVFAGGSSVSFGAYLGSGRGWRPVPVPLTPVAGLTVNGVGAAGPLLSEATTGYYATVNEKVWRKEDVNRTWLVYARQNIRVDARTTLHNQLWYRNGMRLHVHYNNFALNNPGNLYEHNNPFSHMYGDKLWSDLYLPYNQVGIGGYFINTVYNSRNEFYNPSACVTVPPGGISLTNGTQIAAGTSVCGSAAVPNANHRSDYWHITDLAAFLQDAITPIASLTITPGIRVVSFHTDYYPYGPTEFQLSDILSNPTPSNPLGLGLFGGHDQGQLPASQTNYDRTEPSVTARWQPLKWLAVYGNWATAYRLPQVGGGGGLYQSEPVGGDILQRSLEWQVGAKVFWPRVGELTRVLVNLNYYHDHLSNQIIGVNSTNGDFLGLGTGDSVYHGVNFSAEANWHTLKLFTNLNIEKAYFNSYSFLSGSNCTVNPKGCSLTDYSALPVSDTPSSTFNIGAYWTYKFANGLAIKPRAWYQYVGSQYIFNNVTGAPSRQQIPGYGVLNMALATTLPSSWYGDAVKSVKLKLEVMNLLDSKYNFFEYVSAGGLYGTATGGYALAYAGPPRAVYGTISVRF